MFTAFGKCFLHFKQLRIQSINSLYKRIYSFFLADNADAVIDAGTDKVIFFHHATGKDAGFDLFAFSIADSKTYSWMFMLIAYRKAPFIVGGWQQAQLSTRKPHLIIRFCIYSVTAPDNFDGMETFGKLFFSDIHTFEKELHSEIEKIAIMKN